MLCKLLRKPNIQLFSTMKRGLSRLWPVYFFNILINYIESLDIQGICSLVINGLIIPGLNYVINTTNLKHTSLSLHFIKVQSLDMFRALLAHPQEQSSHSLRPTHIYSCTQESPNLRSCSVS
jgi:hypothetical protein